MRATSVGKQTQSASATDWVIWPLPSLLSLKPGSFVFLKAIPIHHFRKEYQPLCVRAVCYWHLFWRSAR